MNRLDNQNASFSGSEELPPLPVLARIEKQKTLGLEKEVEIARAYLIKLFNIQGEPGTLQQLVRSGVLFGEICNRLKPGAVSIMRKEQTFFYLSNLSQSRAFFQQIGFKEHMLFDPSDLQQENPPYFALHSVCTLLFSLALKTTLGDLDDEHKSLLSSSATLNSDVAEFSPRLSGESLRAAEEPAHARSVLLPPTGLQKQDTADAGVQCEPPPQQAPKTEVCEFCLKPTDDALTTYNFSMCMLGSSGVGKTALCHRIVKNQFLRDCKSTVSVDSSSVAFGGKAQDGRDINVNLTLYDTAGMEQFMSVSTQFVRKADIVLLVFSHSDAASFLQVKTWAEFARKANPDCAIVLVGNKADQERLVQLDQVMSLALRLDIAKYVECSAKLGSGLQRIFDLEWPAKAVETFTAVAVRSQKRKTGCC